MACYYPRKGWRARRLNENGKRPIVFKRDQGYEDMEITVPCGQCIGCRLEYSRQWAVRIEHERQIFEEENKPSIFITLTYDEKNLPKDRSLDKSHFKNFMKRLRKRYVPENPYDRKKYPELHKEWQWQNGIRYFMCGEYGEQNGRPHYHAILFNFQFSDQEPARLDKDGNPDYWISETLTKIWGKGEKHCQIIAPVTFESAAYVARYITKKINGEKAEEIDPETGLKHYEIWADQENGEIYKRLPEYTDGSRKPGIGSKWFEKYAYTDLYPKDYCTINDRKQKPPKYYDERLRRENEELYQQVLKKRKEKVESNQAEYLLDRLRHKEKFKRNQIKHYTREV